MKALAMGMARSVKQHNYPLCLRCGHLNNGKRHDRICRCAVPVLAPSSIISDMPLHEARRLPQYKKYFNTSEDASQD